MLYTCANHSHIVLFLCHEQTGTVHPAPSSLHLSLTLHLIQTRCQHCRWNGSCLGNLASDSLFLLQPLLVGLEGGIAARLHASAATSAPAPVWGSDNRILIELADAESPRDANILARKDKCSTHQ